MLGGCVLARLGGDGLCLTLLGIFSIAFLSAVFMFAWNARAFLDNDYFLLFALGCMTALSFEVINLLSQPWFGLMRDPAEIAARSLVAGRVVIAAVLVAAPAYLYRRLSHPRTLVLFLAIGALGSLAIVTLPGRLFVDSSGTPGLQLTVAHITAAAALIVAYTRLNARAHLLHPEVRALARAAILLGIATDIALSLLPYASVALIVGRVFAATSLYFMYKALVEIGLSKPYDVMFRSLQQAEARVRDMSLRDELTGLYNRRGFFSLAEQQTLVSNRTGRVMLLFYCDVDGLKEINDTLGHSSGDMALKDCAEILRETFRESDIIARTGGDEFVVLAIESGNRSIETLRARLEANLLAFERSASRPYKLELSVGVATYDPVLEETLEQTLSRADSLMYRHKHARKRARELERRDSRT